MSGCCPFCDAQAWADEDPELLELWAVEGDWLDEQEARDAIDNPTEQFTDYLERAA